MSICLFPGSFDPVTLGHMDLIRRAAKLYDTVIVAVLVNPDKKGAFSLEGRMELLRRCCRELPGVQIASFEGLLVDFAEKCGADVLLRGLRTSADFEYEKQLFGFNRKMSPKLETVYLLSSEEYACLSSSWVRDAARLGGDITRMVPGEIVQDVYRELRKG